jgi:hypothetical protein
MYVYQRSINGVLETPIISPDKKYIQRLMQADLNKMPADLHATIDEDGTIKYVKTAEHEFSKYYEVEPSCSANNFLTKKPVPVITSALDMLSNEWKEVLPKFINEHLRIIQNLTYTYVPEFTFDEQIRCREICAPAGENDDDHECDNIECRHVDCKICGEITDLPFPEYCVAETMFVHVIKDHYLDLITAYPSLSTLTLKATRKELFKLLDQEDYYQ